MASRELAEGMVVETSSVEETRAFAASIARHAKPGDVIALSGNLGAGKTEFVRGFVSQLEVGIRLVSSPTFTLVNEYAGSIPIYHFDAYRIKHASELVAIGLDEYLFGDGVCLIEWPEVIDHLLPDSAIRLRFDHTASGGRRISRVS